MRIGETRNMNDEGDLQDVSLPSNAGRSRDVDPGFSNDPKARAEAAAMLAYSLHGGNCKQCGQAVSELELCGVGQQIYRQLRAVGMVG